MAVGAGERGRVSGFGFEAEEWSPATSGGNRLKPVGFGALLLGGQAVFSSYGRLVFRPGVLPTGEEPPSGGGLFFRSPGI